MRIGTNINIKKTNYKFFIKKKNKNKKIVNSWYLRFKENDHKFLYDISN